MENEDTLFLIGIKGKYCDWYRLTVLHCPAPCPSGSQRDLQERLVYRWGRSLLTLPHFFHSLIHKLDSAGMFDWHKV